MKSGTLSVVVLLCLTAYTSGQESIAGASANGLCFSPPPRSRFVATSTVATSTRGAASGILCPPSIADLEGVTCVASTRVSLRDCRPPSFQPTVCPRSSRRRVIRRKTFNECCWCCVVHGCTKWAYVNPPGYCYLY
eukprot:g405.t1